MADLSGDPEPWLMRVEGGLSAHFKQPHGPSRAGTDWRVGLKRGAETHTVHVRTLMADDLAPKLKTDSEYLARTAMGYLNDLLNQGWDPNERREHVITVGNPPGSPAPREPGPSRKKPFWKFW